MDITDRWCFSSGSIIAFCLVTILVHFVVSGYTLQLHNQYRRERLGTTAVVNSALAGAIIGTAIDNAEKNQSSDSTTPTTQTTSTSTSTSTSNMPDWEIALIVVGSILGFLTMAGGVWYFDML